LNKKANVAFCIRKKKNKAKSFEKESKNKQQTYFIIGVENHKENFL
jgi:hypothetical protein